MKKKLFVIGIILLSLLLLFGCSFKITKSDTDGETDTEDKAENKTDDKAEEVSDDKEANNDLGDFEIQINGEILENDDKFVIEGKSNLLPGSRIVGEVIVDDGEEVFSDSSELIDEDGSFHIELQHHQFGEAEIVVRFEFESVQDDAIKRHYGEKGQNLEGPIVYKYDVYNKVQKKAEVNVEYNPDGGSDLTFNIPDWNDLPDDYGDPRVWIEIEDITDDGEFYYLYGLSNILEGSKMKIVYGGNVDETQVLPDGSFIFKLNYEYLEDKDFVIEFMPSILQWNEIEEAYGANGQKLVGDLIESDPHGRGQFVEKRIQLDE